MREALASLTTRGRAFLACGIAVATAAVVVGQPDLARVAGLLVALPLLTSAWIGRSRYRLALVRTVSPAMVSAGQQARVQLSLTNEGRTPSGSLLLEDRLPYALGTRPRFVLEGMGHGWERRAGYRVSSDLRGVFDIGPMAVRVSDPFGLVELGRSFHTSTSLTVTPRSEPLPAIPLEGAWTGAGDNRPRAFASGSAEDVTVRDYRRGDDLRRVHWRSSARMGELMVRREEQPWQSRATVFVDNRQRAHRGQGAASSLETAVSVAASISLHLAQRGYAVRLVTASGGDRAATWHSRQAASNTGPLLEALAVVEPDRVARPETGWLTDGHQGGLLFAVLGSLHDGDQPFVSSLLHHSSAALAVVLDVDAWAPRSGRPDGSGGGTATAARLATHGWRAVPLGPRDRLHHAWQDLGRSSPSRQGVP